MSSGLSASELPSPHPSDLAHSERLAALIRQEMRDSRGRLAFDRFMELALYAPGLGYYASGARKFGAEGDFITAPEVSPLFARSLARQCREVLSELGGGDILEFGAGSGRLAVDLLAELERLESLPRRYFILEVSAELRRRQQQAASDMSPELGERMQWLDRVPAGFTGVILANEVLDAMPVHRFRIEPKGIREIFVRWREGGFEPVTAAPQSPGLIGYVQRVIDQGCDLCSGYTSEVNLRLEPWVRMLSDFFHAGLILLIDYGYPAAEYYHAQRTEGTLMCHYRHRAHTDPYRWVGLQDITAQVDFSLAAEAARGAGLQVAGYSSQAHFLLGCGLDRLVAESDPNDARAHLELAAGVKRLTLPTEMGERFKVMALTRRISDDLMGFRMSNHVARL